ncbi:hypothetical protein LTR08_004632 [Meristemomyces frigidus]|nr:hypothetical protein LTR08_004632 [Meristemomyces frigidus]
METAMHVMPPREVATPTKPRSFSDPPAAAPPTAQLQPSPTFRERGSKDDHAIPTTPGGRAPRRPTDVVAHGLSLQMPPPAPATPAPHVNPAWTRRAAAVPLSPKLDDGGSYIGPVVGSPATALPRHSRGLDFSRACTNLHHSTVAEQQSSPDSSPVVTMQKGGVMIPQRKGSMGSMMLDSPNHFGSTSTPWASLAPERSSVGSVGMMLSDSEGSDSDESMGEDQEDAIFTTPQVHKLQNPSAPTPFTAPPLTPTVGASGTTWSGGSLFSPAQTSLLKTMRRTTKVQKTPRRTRQSSSSASGSGYSSMASPRHTSPPPLRSIESAASTNGAAGYNPWATNAARSRRESLALGADGLHLSSGNDSGDEASSHTAPSTPGVVRRPVTRRGNLLPKTKGFARIRAALAEEGAPVDTEIRREAETIRQVRERDNSVTDLDLAHDIRPGTLTAASSPNLLPAVPESEQEDFDRDLDSENSNTNKGLGMNFAAHASRNSGGMSYWNRFDPAMRTPPPPSFQRQGSSVMSDVNMDSPAPTQGQSGVDVFWRRPRARSSASDASEAFNAPAAATVASGMNDDVVLKKFKRRREDDFDIATIKRRAVSPGMGSAQNSPVLTHSPGQRDGQWGQPPDRKKEEVMAARSNSGGSGSLAGLSNGTGKKLGLQGMVDTNDGLMKMSIE